MIGEADVKRVSPQRRPILFAEKQQRLGRRIGDWVRLAPFAKVLPIENTIIFVRHQCADDVHAFARRHQHQALGSIAKNSTIIHMDVSRAVEPALGAHVDPPLQSNDYLRRFAAPNFGLRGGRPEFIAFCRFDGDRARWYLRRI